MTDIEIAKLHKPRPITEIAQKCGIPESAMERYGEYKAKVRPLPTSRHKDPKLVLVTAINPTPAGEGKTTVSVGLADGLAKLGKESVLALREPSLGPVFGMKGGAAGGGYSQVIPMEDINLHFTGDLHAITSANNLLAAMIDNHIFQGNELRIDPRTITWRRCMDMNDRQLRHIISGLSGKSGGVPREDGFDITAASEVMAILCLSENLTDLKNRLSRIIVGYNDDKNPVTAGQLSAHGAMAALLKEAIKPNLVQTLEGTPAFIHGGPFANIAHGCNSVTATKTALSVGEYVVTEAGFGADLGCEKFLDIKCRMAELSPSAVVLVATIRALKQHGGAKNLSEENLKALKSGLPNLQKHVENIKGVFNLPVVVAINKFHTDTAAEIALVSKYCADMNVPVELSEGWEKGGAGCTALASAVVRVCETLSEAHSEKHSETHSKPYTFAYPLDIPLKEKIRLLSSRIYGAADVTFAPGILSQLKKYDELGQFPVCVAKTQYSLSDDPKKLARPEGFTINVRQVKLSAGAGFVVVFTGDIIAMPGLPKLPAAQHIDIEESGNITGIF